MEIYEIFDFIVFKLSTARESMRTEYPQFMLNYSAARNSRNAVVYGKEIVVVIEAPVIALIGCGMLIEDSTLIEQYPLRISRLNYDVTDVMIFIERLATLRIVDVIGFVYLDVP